jgi:hypothetical protein
MNETILASAGDPVGLTVSIAPWPHSGPVDSTATPIIESRVDSAARTPILSIVQRGPHADALAQLHHLMTAALPLMREVEGGKLTLTNSGIVLDDVQLTAALDEWTDATIPVHSLIAFDFALRGDPPGTKSVGLAALVGQEVVAWPPDESLRLVCARMVVRLAHDMLLNGPILTERTFSAPDVPRGSVTLVPRDVPTPVVQIRF